MEIPPKILGFPQNAELAYNKHIRQHGSQSIQNYSHAQKFSPWLSEANTRRDYLQQTKMVTNKTRINTKHSNTIVTGWHLTLILSICIMKQYYHYTHTWNFKSDRKQQLIHYLIKYTTPRQKNQIALNNYKYTHTSKLINMPHLDISNKT